MAFDLATARVRIGLAANDTSKDALLTPALQAALFFAEKYCDRKFKSALESEEFIHFNECEVQLCRYPIASVGLVDRDGSSITNYHLDSKLGRIVFDSRVTAHVLTIDYSGGYSVLPDDLEMALWRLFDTSWIIISGSTESGGTVKAITSAGAKVEFDVSSAAIGASGISDPFAVSILDFYRVGAC